MILKKLSEGANFDSLLDLDIPPAIRCTACLSTECEGCSRPVRSKSALSWENAEGSWARRGWATARQTVKSGASSCLDVNPPSLARALSFAFLAELFAAFSLVVLFLFFLLLALPSGAVFLLTHLNAALALVGLAFGLGFFMVLVHGVWGIALELALATVRAGWQPRRSLAFALYACGWDFLTSPLGVALAVGTSGLKAGMAEVREAMVVPRPAVVRYLTDARGLSEAAASRVALSSFAISVAFALILAVTIAVWTLAPYFVV